MYTRTFSFICKYIILYNIFTSTDGAVSRNVFVIPFILDIRLYTFRHNIWTNQSGLNIRRSNKYTNMRISRDKKTIVYFQKTKNFTSFSSTVRARCNQVVICNKIRIKINTRGRPQDCFFFLHYIIAGASSIILILLVETVTQFCVYQYY